MDYCINCGAPKLYRATVFTPWCQVCEAMEQALHTASNWFLVAHEHWVRERDAKKKMLRGERE